MTVTVAAGKCGSRQAGSSGELTSLTTNSRWQVFKLPTPSLDSATTWGPWMKMAQPFGALILEPPQKPTWSSGFSLLSMGENHHWQPRTLQPVCTLFIHVDVYMCKLLSNWFMFTCSEDRAEFSLCCA